MQGQAVDIAPGTTFIHGGSGWIMSRACAQYYISRLAELNETFISQPHGDDLMPNFFKHWINRTTEEMTSMAFVGSPMDVSARKRLKERDYNNLPICPSLIHQVRSLRMSMYLNETVIWHSGANDLLTVTDGYRILSEAPSWVGLGHIHGAVTLCRADVPLTPETDGAPFT
jgi:hypothetical protein